jgi:accessory gene regulator protein AgrB
MHILESIIANHGVTHVLQNRLRSLRNEKHRIIRMFIILLIVNLLLLQAFARDIMFHSLFYRVLIQVVSIGRIGDGFANNAIHKD